MLYKIILTNKIKEVLVALYSEEIKILIILPMFDIGNSLNLLDYDNIEITSNNRKRGMFMKKKKNKIMTKSSFMQGAFIATFGIVFTKILGVLYVIPFHAIIGEKGGALYGYAYTIYLLFMALSSAGIPLAISKIISEYQTLGYYDAKRRAFKMGKQIAIFLGVVCFLVLFIFAPEIAHAILGNLKGGNSIGEITYVIRVISTAILVVPLLSIYRGYLEGHKYITPTAISQVLEQIFRVLMIIFGSYLTLKIFHLSLTTAVGVAVFGATFGAFIAYFYLLEKTVHYKTQINEKILDVKEPTITNKMIFKKIMVYAIPFIMIDIFKSLYSFADMTTVVKTLAGSSIGYTTATAEVIMGMLSTWAAKFNMIIVSISTGVIVSLIPNLTSSFVLNDMKDVHRKINQTFQILLYLSLPMTVGLSFLAKPVWTVFYGASKYGPSVLSYFVYVALIMSLFTAFITIVQVLKYYKTVFISLATGVLLKYLLNASLMCGFYKMGLPAYYGAITATIIGYLVSLIICLVVLRKKCGVSYEPTAKEALNIISGTVIMVIVLFMLKFIIPLNLTSRLLNILVIIIYTLVGMLVYIFFTKKTGTIANIFGEKMLNKFFKKNRKHS